MTVPLGIQGPFGCSQKFPDLARPEFSSVLLVAGGVGATFILPIYRALVARRQIAGGSYTARDADADADDGGDDHEGLIAASSRTRPKVKMVWAVRSAEETVWANSTALAAAAATSTSGAGPGRAGDLMHDENVDIYVTGSSMVSSLASGQTASASSSRSRQQGGQEAIPLTRLPLDPSHANGDGSGREYINKRPDLSKIVDDVFRATQQQQGAGKVAVLVCGPAAMARELRACVGVWVDKGREVWWHDEGFSW